MRGKSFVLAVMAAACLALAAGPALAQQNNPNKKKRQGSQTSQQGNQMGQQNKSVPQGGPGTSPLVTYGSGGN